MINLAVFASGTGSNAQKIIEHFRDHKSVRVALVVCNKHGAGVLDIATNASIPSLMIDKENFFRGDAYVSELQKVNIHWIILAGFLWKLPAFLLAAYPGRIVNIHPALLPKYGGKGMYGAFVHQAVLDARDLKTGITIHYVDEQYDHGDVIFQVSCSVEKADTAETLAAKVHRLEHQYYPKVIEEVVLAKLNENKAE
jgi:phosphoribosylglycinamide formyltransferase-1